MTRCPTWLDSRVWITPRTPVATAIAIIPPAASDSADVSFRPIASSTALEQERRHDAERGRGDDQQEQATEPRPVGSEQPADPRRFACRRAGSAGRSGGSAVVCRNLRSIEITHAAIWGRATVWARGAIHRSRKRGGAVVTGAAAVGGKLAKDGLSASRRRERLAGWRTASSCRTACADRARSARCGHRTGRTAGSQAGRGRSRDSEAAQAARFFALGRFAMGDETYQRENAAFRDLGKRHRLSRREGPDRDARRAERTLQRRAAAEQTGALRDRLVQSHSAPLRTSPRPGDGRWSAHRAGGGAGQKRVVEIRLRRVRRAPARASSACTSAGGAARAAAAEPSDEHLHEWRKRAKDLGMPSRSCGGAQAHAGAREARPPAVRRARRRPRSRGAARARRKDAFPADEEANERLPVGDRPPSRLAPARGVQAGRPGLREPARGLCSLGRAALAKRAAKHPSRSPAEHARWQPVTRSSASSRLGGPRQPMPRHPESSRATCRLRPRRPSSAYAGRATTRS